MAHAITDLPLGAHLVTPRLGYVHHGIYVGEGKVIHYGGAHRFILQRGPVRETSLHEFARGRRVELKGVASAVYAPDEVVRRARSRLGEDRYHLSRNNCEHFCEWCACGTSRSVQIEKWATRFQRTKLLLRSFSALGQNAVQQQRWSN